MTLFIPLLTLLVMTATLLLPSFRAFDRLVKRQHDLHPGSWEKDGRPEGMFWRAEAPSFSLVSFRSGIATQRCMMVWLFRTPQWVQGDQEAMRLLWRLRRLTLAWNLGMLVFAGAAVLAVYIDAVRHR